MDFELENVAVSNICPSVDTTPGQKLKKASVTAESSKSKTLSTPSRTPFEPRSPDSVLRSGQKDAARDAKLQSTTEKLNKVAELKERWLREKEMKQTLTTEKRSAEQKLLNETSQKEAELRKNRASAARDEEKRKLKTEQEFLESSHLDRAHQIREQEQIEKKRRKQSVLLNRGIMRQNREKEVELELIKKGKEADLHAGRRDDHQDIREAKSAEKERRRESMICRYYIGILCIYKYHSRLYLHRIEIYS
jgi:flagellar biosynthesis GTPase FlhF